jgi:hypothetical protein
MGDPTAMGFGLLVGWIPKSAACQASRVLWKCPGRRLAPCCARKAERSLQQSREALRVRSGSINKPLGHLLYPKGSQSIGLCVIL